MIQPPYPKNIPLLKGSLVTIDDTTQQRTVVAFQYNPDTLNRTLKPNTVGTDDGDRSYAVCFAGAPVQTISLEVQIDGTDQLNEGDPVVAQVGIYPQLANLELLVYPTSSQVTQFATTLATGTLEITPMTAPRTVFVWGPNRVVPVRVTSISVTEQLFDANLNPIRASLTMEMRVLSYSDVFSSNPDYQLFLTYQQNMEQVAARLRASTSGSVTGYDITKL